MTKIFSKTSFISIKRKSKKGILLKAGGGGRRRAVPDLFCLRIASGCGHVIFQNKFIKYKQTVSEGYSGRGRREGKGGGLRGKGEGTKRQKRS